MSQLIKVAFCVAYDWHFLKTSLPLVYNEADAIHLFVDVNRVGWSGASFTFDETSFLAFIEQVDVDNKITLHQESFYLSQNTPPQNEVMQRKRMASLMGEGGWHLQLDCDEYFINFKGFVEFLKKQPRKNRYKTNICCQMITLFKKLDTGYLYVLNHKKNQEYFQIATMDPSYEYGRRNGFFNIYTDFCIIHQSWARSQEEIIQKIHTWGHANDFDKEHYIEFWKSIHEGNYKTMVNFHPLVPSVWERLAFEPAATIDSFLMNFNSEKLIPTKVHLMLMNNRFLAKVKKLIRMLGFRIK